MNQNNILQGSDNTLSNTSTGHNASDVERLDYVNTTGVTATANRAVTVFERGATTGHDSFQIAAITAVDGTGKPTAYGSIVSYNNGAWGTKSLTGNQNYVVVNDASFANFSASTTVPTQDLGGVVIPLTSLTGGANTTIYGYSLFASDVSGSLVDWTNSTNFPTNTPETSTGIDLAAANLGVVKSTAVPFEFSPSLGLLVIGATWGTESLWRRRRASSIK